MTNGCSESGSSSGEAAVLQSMTLLATLQTATNVWEAVEARRAGRDPSAQEPPEVTRPYLWAASRALRQLHAQLFAGYVLAHTQAKGEDATKQAVSRRMADSVRRFDLLMKLSRAARLLQGTHQRLLSLYPEVSEGLVEEARRLHDACEAFQEEAEEAFLTRLEGFLRRLQGFTARMRRELVSRST